MRLLQTIKDFLQTHDINFDFDDDKGLIETNWSAENGSYSILISVDEEKGLLETYTKFPFRVPEKRLTAEKELIIRINDRLPVGNFDLNTDNNIIYFRNSILLGKVRLENELLYNLLYVNLEIADRYWPAIAIVAFKNTPSVQALHREFFEKDNPPSDDSSPDNSDNRPYLRDFWKYRNN